MNLKKIMDSEKVSEEQLVKYISNDLESRLDSGQILFYGGADWPGEYVSYCRTEDLRKCLIECWLEYSPVADLELTPDQINKMPDEELIEYLNGAFSFEGFDLDHKYICIFQDWNDTGDGGASTFDSNDYSRDDNVPWVLYRSLLDYGVPLEKLSFTNINDPEFYEDFEDLVPKEVFDDFLHKFWQSYGEDDEDEYDD